MIFFDCMTNFIFRIFPIVLSLAGLGLLVTIHEFGHFFFCKLFNVHTPTFSIGFGPEIMHKKIGQTRFRLAAVPFGGYVEISGLAEVGQGEQKHAQKTGGDSFESKRYWQKFLILIGGILFNMLFAYFIFCSVAFFGPAAKESGIKIAQLEKDSAAEKYGLRAGDFIVGINQIKFDQTKPEDIFDYQKALLTEIRANPAKEATFLVRRDSEIKELQILLDAKTEGAAQVGKIGAYFDIKIPKLSLFKSIKMGIRQTNELVKGLILGIKKMFTSRSLDGVGGPVMIISQGANIAKAGLLPLLIFLALLSISLAIMNLLPIGALDGGQILFVTIEAIIRRKIPEFIKLGINLASWVLILGLALYLSVREIGQLFGPGIKNLLAKIINFNK
jgi:regulator of sigma E protease